MRYRNGTYRGAGQKVTKASALSKTSADDQAKQLVKIQKQTSKLLKRTENRRKKIYYQHTIDKKVLAPTGGIFAPHYSHTPIINPEAWKGVFNTQSIDMKQSKFQGISIGMEYRLDILTGDNPVTYTIMVLRARKPTATEFAHDTMNGNVLQDGVHFTRAALGVVQGAGMYMINKECFEVLYLKKGMVGTTVSATVALDSAKTQTIGENQIGGYVRIPWKKTLYADGKGLTGNDKFYRTMTVKEVDPADQIHVYCFANNYGEQIVNFYANMIISGYVTA